MVDSNHSRSDHGRKRHHHHHHHHHKSMMLDDNPDIYPSKTSRRSDNCSPLSDFEDIPRSHHHKSRKHRHDRKDREGSRSHHRRKESPRYRIGKHHLVHVKEEPLSPRLNDSSLKSRLSKDYKSSQSFRRGEQEDLSSDADIPRKSNRNYQHSDDTRGNRGDDRKSGGGNQSNDSFKRDKKKLGMYSPSDKYEWGKKSKEEPKEPVEKEKPNFGLSGKLTEDTNMYNGVVIKYSEPPEARKPKRRWRLYPFKGDQALPMMHIHRQSAFLLGRDRKVVDIPIDHPSCSKQHAALQYRLVAYQREDGTRGKRIRPYIIDLESANGTFVNNNRIEPRKYVELMERDVIKFGYSSREYVLLHESSKDEEDDE